MSTSIANASHVCRVTTISPFMPHRPCATTRTAQMAKYDLTSVMGQYLDKHLVLPMLDYLLESDVS